nr:AimR family lysis-lysogeny pheromone receptor [Bacillus licheniformis]
MAEIQPKSSEMKVYSRIIPMYAILPLKQFGRLKDMSDSVLIDTISNQNYVYHSFKSRYMLLLANCFFGNNEIEKAQEYARHGIENSNVKRIIFFSYLTYGSSLMLDDYEKSKSSFLKGLEVGKGNKIYEQHAIRNLCFLENLWGKENQYLNIQSNEIIDRQEVVHYLIRKGSKQQAKKMLDQLDLMEHDDNDLGLHYYLKGLLESSREYFLESVKYFKLSGDKFSCTLPIIELEKLGVEKQILEIISI